MEQKQKEKKEAPQESVNTTSELWISLIIFFVLRLILNVIGNLVYANQEVLALETELLDRVFSVSVMSVVAIVGVILLRKNAWQWNAELTRFHRTRDYQRFRDRLIPLSRQKINFVVQMKAQVNLTWIYSYLGESAEAMELAQKLVRRNKNLIGTTMAYNVWIQELILQKDREGAETCWKEAMEICDTVGAKAPVESLKLRLYGCVIHQQYEEGLQAIENAPRGLQNWAQNSEDSMFWLWYLNRALGRDTTRYRSALEELPTLHHGYAKALAEEEN